MKRGIIMACLIGAVAGLSAQAQETNAPPKPPPGERSGRGGPGGGRALMDQILAPRALEELSLTADQKAKYDVLEKEYKPEVEKIREANKDDMQKAREAFRELRRSYQDKVRAFLTDEQKVKLEKAQERGRAMMRSGGGPGPNGEPPHPPPPPPPPADK